MILFSGKAYKCHSKVSAVFESNSTLCSGLYQLHTTRKLLAKVQEAAPPSPKISKERRKRCFTKAIGIDYGIRWWLN